MKYLKLYESFNSIGRIVFTGVSGSGKSTLVDELKKMGYNVVEEAARQLIAEIKEKDPSKLPWSSKDEFKKLTYKIFNKQLTDYYDNDNSFFDRGIEDIIAYRKAYSVSVDKNMVDLCNKCRYDKVFIFPPFKEIYKTDDERVESFEESSRMHEYLMDVYKRFGYDPIVMINDTIENRIKFIMENI